MGFTTSCFIRKNTPEIRKKLERLGHTICKCCEFEGADWLHVCAIKDICHTVHGVGYTDEEIEIYGLVTQEEVFNSFLKTTNAIDCGTNEELFLALAALRDDTDKNQWFVTEKDEWVKCEREHFYQEHLTKTWRTWYKATVEEIIEYFKDK